MSGHAHNVFVARQPVFDREGHTWGYELLFRAAEDALTADVIDDTQATLQVITDGFLIGSADIKPGQRLLVNFPHKLLLDDSAMALPPTVCVVEVLETVRPTPEVLESLDRLKKSGFTLALDDYAREEELAPFIPHVDIVKADIMQMGSDPLVLRQLVESIHAHGCLALAEKVEDRQCLENCMQAGFDLFQGFFFSRPVVIPGRKLSSAQTTRLQLIQKLGTPDMDPDELASIIQSDPSLSYRLLQTINSAGYGLRTKIDSVRRAISFLGLRHIALWLRAVLLSDMGTSAQAQELVMLSLHRARFLEQLGISAKPRHEPEKLFLLGLFSLLDSLMGMKMTDILEPMPLPDDLQSALAGEAGELTELLRLSHCLEKADYADCSAICSQINMAPQDMAALYSEALLWAGKTLGRGENTAQ